MWVWCVRRYRKLLGKLKSGENIVSKRLTAVWAEVAAVLRFSEGQASWGLIKWNGQGLSNQKSLAVLPALSSGLSKPPFPCVHQSSFTGKWLNLTSIYVLKNVLDSKLDWLPKLSESWATKPCEQTKASWGGGVLKKWNQRLKATRIPSSSLGEGGEQISAWAATCRPS